MDMMKTAVSGTDAIRKKDILEDGYVAEAQLTDGDIDLFIGAKVTSYTRGDKAGEPKFETMLYAKDINGKKYTPLIDGEQPSAADYTRMLTTELTFAMPDLFSENQTIHRNFIEKLYKDELDKLGADKVVANIVNLKKVRDNARAMCQANGAFMEALQAEGWKEQTLEMLQEVNVEQVEEQIYAKRLEKDRKVNATDTDYELAKERLTNERNTALLKIKEEGAILRKQMEDKYSEELNTYNATLATDKELRESSKNILDKADVVISQITELLGLNEEGLEAIKFIKNGSQRLSNEYLTSIVNPNKPTKDAVLSEAITTLLSNYKKLEESPLNLPNKDIPDVSDLDKEINNLIEQKEGAKATNDIYKRYQLNKNWRKADGEYLAELDVLRKMYASINCGVEGMNIVPRETNSGKIEVWIQYNGEYDIEFFKNPNKEQRMMFEYSSFQRTIIGLMLQAARLNLKKKALRLAFVDDVAFTENGINILRDVAERLNLQLVVAWTHEVEKDNLRDGEVAVIGGEIFFN